MKILDRMNIFSKIMGLVGVSIILFVVVSWFFILPSLNKVMLLEKKSALKDNIDIATSVIKSFHDRAVKGEMSDADARQKALEQIRFMRYMGTNYFFIFDTEGIMRLHPAKPENEGKNMMNFADPTGFKLFYEMEKMCQAQNEGWIMYLWPKPQETVATEKVSYSSIFKPWGWIIGTGAWTDDINAQVKSELENTKIMNIVYIGLIAIVIFLLGFVLSKAISGKIIKATNAAQMIAQGDMAGASRILG